ncbi:MAG: hypothetical protein IKX68_09005 [Clostridiales bacterium]|nr:hypothetical protein [Clostridiales bacterium]
MSIICGTACNKKIQTAQTDSNIDSFSTYYSTSCQRISVPDALNGAILEESICVQTYSESEEFQDKITDYYYKKWNGEDAKLPLGHDGELLLPDNRLLFYTSEGTEVSEYDLNEITGPSLVYREISSSGDSVWALSVVVDDSGNESLSADRIDPKNGLIEHVQLPMVNSLGRIMCFYVDSEDRFLLMFMDSSGMGMTSVYTKDGQLLSTFPLPSLYVSNLAEGQDSTVVAANDINANECFLYRLDLTDMRWEKQGEAIQPNSSLLEKDGRLYCYDTKHIVSMDRSNPEEVIWEDVSVWGTIGDVKLIENREILVLSKVLGGDSMILYHLIPSTEDPKQNRSEIVIAGYDLDETCVPQLVEELSVLHPEVHYVVRDYRDEVKTQEDHDNWKQVQREIYEIMSLDIASGHAPDIYYDQYNDTGFGEMARLGYLMDISPNLKELDEKSFFLDKMTMGQDEVYEICLTFDILGFAASPHYVVNPEVWTYDDFYSSASRFTDLSCVQSVYSKRHLLKSALLANQDDYIVNGIPDFNSDKYKQLLTWANDIGCKTDWDEYVSADLDDGLFMLDWANIASFQNIMFLDNHKLVGFPGENGSLHMKPYNILAISATTQDPKRAWEVLDYAISEEFQSRCEKLSSENSVNKAKWSHDFDDAYTHAEEYTPDRLLKSKEEYQEEYLSYIERADHYMNGSQTILDICLDEADAFFEGDYSVDHVAELTQDRVNLYLQETK